ncbi:transposase family protein [Streptomyces sp. NPDC094472]|uniref:transposase family protein n=1 Tax=Streptomyces sp. NPDC094472 TaxID=3155080 RepID=UPI003323FD5E
MLPCPDCGRVSVRVHSRYRRRLADVAVGGRSVVIHRAATRSRRRAGRLLRRL